ncbi:MAG TPA: M48 family metallopeptidase [Blastocatellia bacterium]|nr:M48 family metallopeptidase [Blastocatellia bacterium]
MSIRQSGKRIIALLLVAVPITVALQTEALNVSKTQRPVYGWGFTNHPDGGGGPDDWQRGKEKARKQRILFVLRYGLNLGALWLIFITGLSARLMDVTGRLTSRRGGQRVVYLVIFFSLIMLLNLPLDLYASYGIGREYGLITQTLSQWLRDYAVAQAIALVIFIGVVLGLYRLFGRRRWWAWATLVSIPVIVFLIYIAPVVLAPLFNRFTPLPESPLKGELLAFARSEGVPAEDVFVMDASRQSRAVNAYVIGIGPTKRIVLYDTLLERFTLQEIMFVLAHEIGHYRFHHVWKFIAAGVLAVLWGCLLVELLGRRLLRRATARVRVTDLADSASLPLVGFVFLVACGVAFPILNTYSRHLEREADRFAISRIRNPVAAITAFEKLGRLNVSEYEASPLVEIIFYDHPTLARRIRFVREFSGGE